MKKAFLLIATMATLFIGCKKATVAPEYYRLIIDKIDTSNIYVPLTGYNGFDFDKQTDTVIYVSGKEVWYQGNSKSVHLKVDKLNSANQRTTILDTFCTPRNNIFSVVL